MTTTGNTEITKGSRVRVTLDVYPWLGKEGFVVETKSDRSDDDSPIAVFFGPEIQVTNFCAVAFQKIIRWDKKHKEQLDSGNLDFLLDPEVWHNCPRITHLAPDELTVIQD